MARILAIDYGGKRCGLAATDPLQIVASPIGFQFTSDLMSFLKNYFKNEDVACVVLGYPTKSDGSDTDATALVRQFKIAFEKEFADKPIVLHDESRSSQHAMQAMVAGGMKKKKRREKGQIDTIAAALILQSYMQSR